MRLEPVQDSIDYIRGEIGNAKAKKLTSGNINSMFAVLHDLIDALTQSIDHDYNDEEINYYKKVLHHVYKVTDWLNTLHN